MEDAVDVMKTVQWRMQWMSWGQCNGGWSRQHGHSAMEDAADSMDTVQWRMQRMSWGQSTEDAVDVVGKVQWRMQWISGGHCNGGCSRCRGDSAMEDGADIMRWVEATEDEDYIWKKV